jgi:hypothetical protein
MVGGSGSGFQAALGQGWCEILLRFAGVFSDVGQFYRANGFSGCL